MSWKISLFSLAFISSNALALCGGSLDNNNFKRPIDVNDIKERENISLVEIGHFDRDVASLTAGINEPLPGDIHYTLMHVPNHYRALKAMATWQIEVKKGFRKKPPAYVFYYDADCYFDRALLFRPEDPTIHALAAIYYHQDGRQEAALKEYKIALALKPDDPEINYNIGLLYAEMGQADNAYPHAKKAYDKGYPLPGLRNKLKRLGAWKE